MEIIFLSRKKIGADLIDSYKMYPKSNVKNGIKLFWRKNKKMFWNLLPKPEQCYFQAKKYCF